MRKSFALLLTIFLLSISVPAQIISGYNQQFYTNVLDAAWGIGKPFFLQQGYLTMQGVSIYQDTLLRYKNHTYHIRSKYQNPVSPDTINYYLAETSYSSYQMSIFKNVWPNKIPDILYESSDSTYFTLVDCVGYGSRLLSAIGDTTIANNAYLSLSNTIKTSGYSVFASRGYVCTAYEVGAAFPTLPDVNVNGWAYISGNIMSDSIDAYNHRLNTSLTKTYNGKSKGNFNTALPGDVLAFSYSPTSDANGHFMVLVQAPYQVTADTMIKFYPKVSSTTINQFLTTYHVWAVPVVDCSGKGAHFYDSRVINSGIGYGVLWILTDPSTETPMGFIFDQPSSSATSISPNLLNASHTWAISVGRYKGSSSGIGDNHSSILPASPVLYQNYPNPFNPSTKITYALPSEAKVTLELYSITGQKIAVLVNKTAPAGYYDFSFNMNSYRLSSGMYIYKLSVKEVVLGKQSTIVKKMMLIK